MIVLSMMCLLVSVNKINILHYIITISCLISTRSTQIISTFAAIFSIIFNKYDFLAIKLNSMSTTDKYITKAY